VARLLLLTPAELTRDPRARRQAELGRRLGFEVAGLSGQVSGEPPLPLAGVPVARVGAARARQGLEETRLGQPRTANPVLRELLGAFRLARLARRSIRFWRAGRALGRFDVVHANDLDTLPAASLLARGWRARLVYDAHELYSAFERDPPRLALAVTRRVEAALARGAAAVVTVSEPLADELVNRLALRREPIVVLNAAEVDEHEPAPTAAAGPLLAIYQGAIGFGRSLEDLLEAVAAAPNVQLRLLVVRVDPDGLRSLVAERGLDSRVAVSPPVAPNDVLRELRTAEVGIVFDRPVTPNARLSLPNKLFEYLMAGLALAVPRLPAMAGIVEQEDVGVVFEPGRPDDLARALEELAADRERLAELRRRARLLALNRYNADAQGRSLAAAWGRS
jgi:glycogen(starch) synthase